jgi:hypothetical protein
MKNSISVDSVQLNAKMLSMIEAEGNGLSGPQFANSGKKLYDDNST